MDITNKILIITVENWEGLARLPKALKEEGFKVGVICLPNSFISKTKYLDQIFLISKKTYGIAMLRKIVNIINCWNPTLIVPGDDWIVGFLHHWIIAYKENKTKEIYGHSSKCLISSFGDPKYFRCTTSKKDINTLAISLNVRCPKQVILENQENIQTTAYNIGYPLVLKQEFSSGGNGVRICFSEDELSFYFETFREERRKGNNTLIQEYVDGKTIMSSCISVSGEVLSSITALKKKTYPEVTGPSTVITVQDKNEIIQATRTLLMRLKYTGFSSFDFILDDNKNLTYLLEMNPRPTPICHLGKILGHNLCKALFLKLNGYTGKHHPLSTSVYNVALFPQEWRRDQNSPFIKEFYHDVPWEDIDLLKAYVNAS